MSRERRWARDGPSARAPGATMEGANKERSVGPDDRGKRFCLLFPRLEKVSRPGGRNQKPQPKQKVADACSESQHTLISHIPHRNAAVVHSMFCVGQGPCSWIAKHQQKRLTQPPPSPDKAALKFPPLPHATKISHPKVAPNHFGIAHLRHRSVATVPAPLLDVRAHGHHRSPRHALRASALF